MFFCFCAIIFCGRAVQHLTSALRGVVRVAFQIILTLLYLSLYTLIESNNENERKSNLDLLVDSDAGWGLGVVIVGEVETR